MNVIKNKFLVLMFTLTAFCSLPNFVLTAHGQINPPPQSRQFINGQWFDGNGFRRQTFYSVDGVLTRKKPSKIDETVDLKNGFVVPPFADAHCHHFDGAYNVDQQIGMYLKDGVFYAKVLTDVRSGAMQVANKVNKPASVDVSYSHGGLTHSYGHPIEVYERFALGIYGGYDVFKANEKKIAASRLRENDAYYVIDTAADLEKKWQKILDGKPDFIKIYLLSSESFAEKRDKIPNIEFGSIGLDPELVPAIIQKAHSANLRVSAHVDTVTDYRIALNAGVDEMAHLPGYLFAADDKLEKFQLTAADARETARRKIWVVPAPVPFEGFEPNALAKIDTARRQNLNLLKKYKVRLAFGSDSYGSTPNKFVSYLAKLNVFSNLEMLKIWCEDTPQTIFPNRRIGFLKEGYEANFIVLEDDPISDFAAIKNIKLRFKQGYLLDAPK